MLIASQLKLYLEEELEKWEIESKKEEDGYITTFGLPVTFRDEKGVWVGDLIIHFKIIGFGIDGYDGGIDIYYHIPAFKSGKDGDEEFFEDAEAFAFVFGNFREEIQSLVDEVSDMLFEHFDEGSPLTSLLDD